MASLPSGLQNTNWTQVNIGGGGNNSGAVINTSGVAMVRGDYGGPWLWTGSRWYNAGSSINMPSTLFGYSGTFPRSFQGVGGSIEVALCNSGNCGALYTVGHILYSNTINPANPTALRWCDDGMPSGGSFDTANNVVGRQDPGGFAQIDPQNNNHMLVAGLTAIYETFNAQACLTGGTATFTAISTSSITQGAVPNNAIPAYNIAFDPTSGTHACNGGASTCTAKAYVSSYSNQVFQTTDGGNTWTGIGGPATLNQIHVSPATAGAGNVWVTTFNNPGSATITYSGATATVTGLTAGVNIFKTAQFCFGGGSTCTNVTSQASGTQFGNGVYNISPSVTNAAVASSVSSSNFLLEFSGGVWTDLGVSGVSDVAIEPSNGNNVAALNGPDVSVSTNGAASPPSFTRLSGSNSGSGDSPWANGTQVGFEPGALVFDPSRPGVLLSNMGQWTWTVNFTSIGPYAWNTQSAGQEGLILSMLASSAQGSITVGAEDESGCLRTIATAGNTATVCAPVGYATNLSFMNNLSVPFGSTTMYNKSSADFGAGFDYSGSSTDGYVSSANYAPFNSFISTNVNGATAISNNGSGLVRLTLPSTSGLNNFVAGTSTINNSILCGVSFKNPNFTGGFNLGGNCFEISNVTPTTVDLVGSTFFSGQQAGTYTFFVPAMPLSNWWGNGTVISAGNSGGAIQIVTAGGMSGGAPLCLSGATTTMGPTVTKINGCWVVSGGGNTFTLLGSTWGSGDTFTGGGTAVSYNSPGGSIAAASSQDISVVGADNNYPLCTADGGAHWTEVHPASDTPGPSGPNTVTGGGTAGSTAITVSADFGSNGPPFQFNVQLASGRYIPLYASSYGVDHFHINLNAPIPVGDSIPNGAATYGGTGWPFAAFLSGQTVVADGNPSVNPHTFYGFSNLRGLLRWTSCGTATIIQAPNGTWNQNATDTVMKNVPGEGGQLWFIAGPQFEGSNPFHPAGNGVWRMCGAASGTPSWQQVPGFFEPWAIGFGKAGGTGNTGYPDVYIIAWYDPSGSPTQANAVYGIWKSTNDPNHNQAGACNVSSNTWTNIGTSAQNAPNGFPLGWPATPLDIMGDQFLYGPVYFSGGQLLAYGIFNYLLKRDLDPASNDNSPAFLSKAA